MKTKERELLEKILNTGWLNHELSCEVEAILAQPEQENLTPRQGLEEYKKGYYQAELDLKREPLTDEKVCEILLKKEWKGFVELVRIIEKEHGIGGGE
jgi:hypothetical protein